MWLWCLMLEDEQPRNLEDLSVCLLLVWTFITLPGISGYADKGRLHHTQELNDRMRFAGSALCGYKYICNDVGQDPGVVTWHSQRQHPDLRAKEQNMGRKCRMDTHTNPQQFNMTLKDAKALKSILQTLQVAASHLVCENRERVFSERAKRQKDDI